jgi:predicted naringenin-chalcone synthase
MHLSDSDMQYSYKVLSEYGNMSSPTILFVLNEIMQAEHALMVKPYFQLGLAPD